MLIKPETIDLIRERAQIQEVVKKYVPTLQKKGRNYLGLCPFHKEKTPSFTVSPDKQIFYCFGCQTGGNVFAFIQKVERLNFPESVRHLGDMLGIRIEEEASARRETPELDRLKKVNTIALQFFRAVLASNNGKKAREYLEKRGVNDASIGEFSIGFVTDEWDSLCRHLEAKSAPMDLALKLGLASAGQKDPTRNYDRFRNRIMFPIFNAKNEVVAFGGRVMDQSEPKYLNSPESDLFHKGNILYGFNRAQAGIKSMNRAIIVEGYLDVIGCHQAGITNVVAPLGTALTQTHVQLLSRHCSEIVVLFDADSAGIKASLRSLDVAKEYNVEVRVAELQSGDPFDFVTGKGPRELMAVIDTARKPVEFLIARTIIAHQGKDRMELLVSLFDILREIEFDSERGGYMHAISERLKIREDAFRADYRKYLAKSLKTDTSQVIKERKKAEPAGPPDYLTRTYRELVLLLCRHTELLGQALIDFSVSDIPDPVAREIYRRLGELFQAEESISIDRIVDFFTDGEEKLFLEKNLFKEYNLANPGSAYTEIYINLKLYLIDRKIDRYVNLVKSGDPARVDIKEYLTEVEILRREKEKLSSYVYNKIV